MKLMKKLAAISSAAAMCLSLSSVMPQYSASALELGTYEAEELELDGCTVWTSIYETEVPGYSGEGFVYQTNGTIRMEVEAPEEGMYEISCRFVQILNEEGRQQSVKVNGVSYMKTVGYTKEWKDFSFGNFRLKKGVNEIEFVPQYGYAAYDTITVQESTLPELVGNTEPCDPKATDETRSLLGYLSSVYGSHILSGQQEVYGGGASIHQSTKSLQLDTAAGTLKDNDGNVYTYDEADLSKADDGSTFVWKCYDENGKKYEYDQQNRQYKLTNYDLEFDYLKELTGDYPAIRGFDLMNYNPMYGWEDGSTERLIDWVNNKNGIATVCWHLNVPTAFGSYEVGEPIDWTAVSYKPNTTFDVAKASVEGTKENDFFKLCVEDLAEQLLLAQEAGCPILFRPFHEAEGNGGLDGKGAWFWWSQNGVEPYKALWKYLYKELTETYGLHNLIWVQNLYAWSDESAEWYVGDDYVDIVGLDKYNCVYNRHDGKTSGPNLDAESGIFYSIYDHVDGKKMVAMPENDTVPSLENLTVEKAGWLYFCVWYDNGQENFLSGADKQDPEELKKLYQSDYCLTLSEMPEDLYTGHAGTPGEKPTEQKPTEEKPTEQKPTEDKPADQAMPGDVDGSGGVDILDVIALNRALLGADSLSDTAVAAADVDGDGKPAAADSLLILKYVVKLIDSFEAE